MNDWSRLAVDPKRCKNSRPKNELHEHIYVTDRGARARAVFDIVELARPPSGGSRGQLRLSLTNTYHEWPVKSRSIPVPKLAGAAGRIGCERRVTGVIRLRHEIAGFPWERVRSSKPAVGDGESSPASFPASSPDLPGFANRIYRSLSSSSRGKASRPARSRCS